MAVITSQLSPEAEYTCHIRAYQQHRIKITTATLYRRAGAGLLGPLGPRLDTLWILCENGRVSCVDL